MKQQNRVRLLIVLCGIIGLILAFTTVGNCQQGMKASYTSKKVVTVESLIKDAQLFDTFQETGVKVYYKKRTKKDGSTEDYYFIVVEKQRKNGEKYLSRQRIYPVFANN